jgi:hypothetical protein
VYRKETHKAVSAFRPSLYSAKGVQDIWRAHCKNVQIPPRSRLPTSLQSKETQKVHQHFRAVFGARNEKTGSGTAAMAISKPVLPHFMRFCLYFAVKSKKKRLLPW